MYVRNGIPEVITHNLVKLPCRTTYAIINEELTGLQRRLGKSNFEYVTLTIAFAFTFLYFKILKKNDF